VASVDDSRLTELAADVPVRLFPVLDRASAMRPLVVLMAVLPGLTALVAVPLPSRTARVEPVAGSVESSTNAVPRIISPWGRWLSDESWRDCLNEWSDGWFAEWRLAAGWCSVVPSYVMSAVLVWMVWHSAGGLFGARTGFVAAVLMCCHAPVLCLGRVSEPLALAAVVSAVAVTGLVVHLDRRRSLASWSLLVSIMGLAATVLIGTSLIWAVLLLVGVALSCHPSNKMGMLRNGSQVIRTRFGKNWHRPICGLAVLGGAALLVGAWSIRSGSGLWDSELWDSAAEGLAGWETVQERVQNPDWPRWLGWLSGPVLLGIVEMFRRGVGPDRGARPAATLTLAWSIAVLVTIGLSTAGYPLRLAESFAVIPVGLLAALGIDSICERRVGVGVVVAATCVSVGLGAEGMVAGLFEATVTDWAIGPWQRVGLLAVLALAAGAGVWLSSRGSESTRRRVLLACLLLILAAQMVTGWLQVGSDGAVV